MFDFGLRLRELREAQRLSQAQLGKKVGRSKSVICSYENNIKFPPAEVLVELAVVFNVSLDYLVGIEKREMVSVSGLTAAQKNIVELIIAEFKEKNGGLSSRKNKF